MRERMDFSSIALLINNNAGVNWMGNVPFYDTMFHYALYQSNYKIPIPDDSRISRYISGVRPIKKDIIQIYKEDQNIQYLQRDVTKVINQVAEKECLLEQLQQLLQMDCTIPSTVKKQLWEQSAKIELFVTECLMYGMSRTFIPKNSNGIREKKLLLTDYLLDAYVPKNIRTFVGRESELNEIYKQLSGESCLFLEGIGGIGKSELVRQYASLHKKDYENILYLSYHTDLKHTIIDLDFIDDRPDMTESERFDLHFRFFQSLNQHTLVILDNFNSLPELDPWFYEFLSLPFLLLVTTRSHLEDIPVHLVTELEPEQLLQLFYAYAPESAKEPTVVLEIIRELHGHTLIVEMAAKTLNVCALHPSELLSSLKDTTFYQSKQNKISITKDQHRENRSPYEHLNVLFQLQELSETKMNLLRYLALMPEQGIPKRIFFDWLPERSYDLISELIQNGWIKQDETTYKLALHPVILEMINTSEPPNKENCDPFLRGILTDCLRYNTNIPYGDVLYPVTKSILGKFAPGNPEAFSEIQYQMECYITEHMQKHTKIESLTPQDAILYNLFSGSMSLHDKDYETAADFFSTALFFGKKVDLPEFICGLYYYLGISRLYQCLELLKSNKTDEAFLLSGRGYMLHAIYSKGNRNIAKSDYSYFNSVYTPLIGDATEAKQQLDSLCRAWETCQNGSAQLWMIYEIQAELQFYTFFYEQAIELFLKTKQYYQQFPQKNDTFLLKLDSKIAECQQLYNDLK